ncbi:hypothetical protein HMPREF0281_00850 [Corynebacterium ammoniagenes DSM 20306]|uniref:Uncharacterized protein n=2 Tax=Corynebacterium ammoniagenes TaxID=1697 RepID=A0ABN0AG58_CORAM|nr:hypothetical protein HMPREF0281_00850 [Corynebacterium ammoniagenes DSM 20306]
MDGERKPDLMIGIAIIIAEILFWVFLLGGLFSRYGLGWKKFGLGLLILTPIVDLVLIALTYSDLASGESPTFFHGLSAYYVGFSLVFGHDVISSLATMSSLLWTRNSSSVSAIVLMQALTRAKLSMITTKSSFDCGRSRG